MTAWEWVEEFANRGLRDGDHERQRLVQFAADAYEYRWSDANRMLALLDEGRRLALHLNEPWWVLIFDHLRVEGCIYYKDDYREVLDLVVRLVLEARQPAYEQHPLRFAIHCNLIAAYLGIDPRGHADAIREALAYLGTQAPVEGEGPFLLQGRRHWFAYELGDFAAAEALALEELALADAERDRQLAVHHEIDTYKALCLIAMRRWDWSSLAAHATAGEERRRSAGYEYEYELSLFLLWRALLARREGHEEEAKRLVRLGTNRLARLGQTPAGPYYDILCAYHELGEQFQAALQAREHQLVQVMERGQWAAETECRIHRCRLLVKMGEPVDVEVELARTAFRRLRDPSWYLAELARALAGGR